MLVDAFKSDVLDTDGDNSLFVPKAKVELFFLVDLDDVEVTTAGSASEDAGDQSAVPDRSAVVVAGSAFQKFGRGEERENWLLLAGSEVGDLVDFINLVVFFAELVESLSPWVFTFLAAAGIKRFARVALSQSFVISASQIVTRFLGVGFGGGLLSLGLVLSFVLESRLIRTSLADGVVSLTFSVDGFLHSLKEETRIVILIVTTDRVGLTVHVSFHNDIGSGGVNNDLGDLSTLDVDQSLWKIFLDLDGDWDSLVEGHQDWGFKSLPHLFEEFNLFSLLDITFTGGKFLLGFNNFDILGLDGKFVVSQELDVQLVLDFESSVLVVDDADSVHVTTPDAVNILRIWSPGVVGGDGDGQDCQGEEAEGDLHVELKADQNFWGTLEDFLKVG